MVDENMDWHPTIENWTNDTIAVIWSRNNGTNMIVQAKVRPPGGEFGPVIDLSASGGLIP